MALQSLINICYKSCRQAVVLEEVLSTLLRCLSGIGCEASLHCCLCGVRHDFGLVCRLTSEENVVVSSKVLLDPIGIEFQAISSVLGGNSI